METKSRRSMCPVSYFLDFFGDKWTLVILRDLLMAKKSHYKEFLASEEGIATNILADRLNRLEKCGLVEKRKDPENKRQNIYLPTKKSRDLIPVLTEMIKWSTTHDDNSPIPAAAKKLNYSEVNQFIEEKMRALHNN